MSVSQRIRHELREIGIVTAYFLFCFLFFLTLKKLLLDEYHVEVHVLSKAVIGALVMAKVVVLLGKTSFGNFLRSRGLVFHVLWRSLLYTAAAFLVTAAERSFDAYRELGGLAPALRELWAGRNADHFLAMNLCIGLSLVVYNVFGEIDRALGEGTLRNLFLPRRRRRQEPAAD